MKATRKILTSSDSARAHTSAQAQSLDLNQCSLAKCTAASASKATAKPNSMLCIAATTSSTRTSITPPNALIGDLRCAKLPRKAAVQDCQPQRLQSLLLVPSLWLPLSFFACVAAKLKKRASWNGHCGVVNASNGRFLEAVFLFVLVLEEHSFSCRLHIVDFALLEDEC